MLALRFHFDGRYGGLDDWVQVNIFMIVKSRTSVDSGSYIRIVLLTTR